MTPLFQGEVQLRRWSESSSQGVQVTFALADSDDLEPLKMKSGKRFMAVLVEIGDDELPVQPPKEPIGPLCKWLVMRCIEPDFWEWLTRRSGPGVMPVRDKATATRLVKSILGIHSRREIDGNADLERAFHEQIRQPYQKWSIPKGGT